MNETFFNFCKIGNLNGIIEHINMNKINIHANDEEGFIMACVNKYEHIVKYLIKLHKIRQSRDSTYSKINIHINNNRHKPSIEYFINHNNLNSNDDEYFK